MIRKPVALASAAAALATATVLATAAVLLLPAAGVTALADQAPANPAATVTTSQAPVAPGELQWG